MFCQYCGTEATHELNYCKRCGGNLNPPGGASDQHMIPRPTVSPGAVWGMGITTAAITLIGLVILFVNIQDMGRLPSLPAVAIVWIALFGALTIMGSVALLIRLWMRLLGNATLQTDAKTPTTLQPPRRHAATNELPPQRFDALPPQSIGSVTEHTTRTFDPVYRESQSK